MNFIGMTLANSRGDVLFDPALPFKNVSANVDGVVASYVRTFGFIGRTASVAIAVPYVSGAIEGEVAEEARRVDRSGIGDVRVRLAVNLVGGPALEPREFAAAPARTTLGASLQVVAPTGQYFPSKLINIGANRWAFEPELGVVHPAGRWSFELGAGAWFFTTNDDFYGGHTRRQDPLAVAQGHVSYTFKPRCWVAVSATYYAGGQTHVDGAENADRQENSRAGVTLSLPIGRRNSFRMAWSRGVTARIGSKLETIAAGWQYAFHSGSRPPRARE
jgi:hypothetical protein